jgi:hypothetical protein
VDGVGTPAEKVGTGLFWIVRDLNHGRSPAHSLRGPDDADGPFVGEKTVKADVVTL